MYVGENKGRITSMPWLAPSIAVATRVNNFFDPVGTHWGAGERAVATGGMGYDIVDQEPMWAWLRRRTPTAPNFGGSAVRRAGDKPTSGELFLWA